MCSQLTAPARHGLCLYSKIISCRTRESTYWWRS